jgi:hypothetical protein
VKQYSVASSVATVDLSIHYISFLLAYFACFEKIKLGL